MATKKYVSLHTVCETPSLVIQQIGRTIWINGNEARLSPQEQQLFDYLTTRLNQTISQKTLKSFLYPTGKKVDPKMIAISISKLRRKLGPASELIQTIHGVGFRWDVN